MKATEVRFVEVDLETAGQRLDNFLVRLLKGLPKSRIYRIIRKGEVRINGKRAKPHVRLQAGDSVRIPPIKHLPERKPAIGSFKNLEETIVYEDNFLLVINKPAGMAVHGGSGVKVGVIETLRHVLPEGDRLELVHRLDRGTSGCLMIAKKRSYLKLLQSALRDAGQIRKSYIAAVYGDWPDSVNRINAELQTKTGPGGERLTRVSDSGKYAVTEFEVLERANGTSLVMASPLTGRTHQIRVHTRWARHPIIGDTRYGDEHQDHDLKPKRMMLHACRLAIPAMGDQPPHDLVAPMDVQMKEFIAGAFGKGVFNTIS